MKTKLFSAILTLLALVSFSFHCQAGDPTYKVLTETHEYLSFVLIREITERHEQ